ncbi:outer membrane protein transport protein [Ectopseudomonas mendocina]|nr:outer membrane protein transport protein [Pseudomonas mendocina]
MKTFGALRAAQCLPLLALCHPTYATDVLRLEGFGPISRAMGGTAMAFDTGTAGMMSNPATLSLSDAGSRFSIGLDVIQPEISTKNLSSGETADSKNKSNNRGPYYAPQIAYTYRDDRWAIGVGAFAQGGLGTEYGNRSFLSAGASGQPSDLDSSSRLIVLNIPFAVSYDVTDSLTLGASLDAMWMGMNLDMMFATPQVGALIGSGRADGSLVPVIGGLPALEGAHISFSKNEPIASGADSWGYGGRVGLLWKASESTNVGVSYNFASEMGDLKGDATVTAVDGIAGQIPLKGKIKIRDFQMPASLTVGIAHAINDRWLVAADVSRVFWRDVMKDINVTFNSDSGGNLNLALPQDYKDQTIFSVGTSYRIDNWILRAGYRQATEAAQSDLLFAAIPVTPTKHASAGVSYDMGFGSFDLAYTHAFEKTTTNRSQPNAPVPIRNTHSQDNLVLSYTHNF